MDQYMGTSEYLKTLFDELNRRDNISYKIHLQNFSYPSLLLIAAIKKYPSSYKEDVKNSDINDIVMIIKSIVEGIDIEIISSPFPLKKKRHKSYISPETKEKMFSIIKTYKGKPISNLVIEINKSLKTNFPYSTIHRIQKVYYTDQQKKNKK